MSFTLYTLSENWKPFEPGINVLLKNIDFRQKIGIENMKLVHYCGKGAEIIAKKHFEEYFNI